MTLPLPDPQVDQKPWEDERQGVQRNFDMFAQRFPLECSATHFRQFPQVRARRTTNLSAASGAFTTVTLPDAETYDLGTSTEQHSTSTNTARLTSRAPGLYVISGYVEWTSNSTGKRTLELLANGATRVVIDGKPANTESEHSITGQFRFAIDEYVEMRVFQNSGGALNITSAALAWHWVSP